MAWVAQQKLIRSGMYLPDPYYAYHTAIIWSGPPYPYGRYYGPFDGPLWDIEYRRRQYFRAGHKVGAPRTSMPVEDL